MPFTEANFENAVLHLVEALGYTRLYGPDIARDYRNPLYMEALTQSLPRVNPGMDAEALREALYQLTHVEHGELVSQNRRFMDWLQNGVEVSYRQGGKTKNALVRLVDFAHVESNTFHIINQWTVAGGETKRPDVIVFVNGLPLVVVELKSCARAETDFTDGYRQLKNYMREIPQLFIYNAFLIISDLTDSKAGTLTSGLDRFMDWKTVDGSYEETQYARYDVLFEGMLERARLLDLLQNYLLYAADTPEGVKILAAYHQYYAVSKAVASTRAAAGTDGRAGVFWHTQGSGKSLSMVFYAHLLQAALDSPTLVVVTDRNDLDDQLYQQFAACEGFLRQTPVRAESREHLKTLLAGRQANGIFFTTLQKFEETAECLSDRRNIIVMADEAHRSQYGLTERVGRDGRVMIGAALALRQNLPNATFIGFTGTPVALADRNTREVFGEYIDVYDMTQAVEDGATRPVYYESRVINLGLKEDVLRQIDATYELLALNADERDIERSKKELGTMESVLGAPETIDSLCRDIIAHYEENREHLLTGKAMVVAYSRPIAMAIYRRMLELRPGWADKVKVVMTSGNNDEESWRPIIGNKAYKKELARRFKDNDDPMKIAIVVDMWLTGFDVPSLATMYVFKPMVGHNLMQAIARVNRVFQDKEGGLIVDYIGLARALKDAMNAYTNRDQKNYGEMNIAKTALPKFTEKLRVCRELFHRFDYASFLSDTCNDRQRADLIAAGINHVLGLPEEQKQLYLKEALLLHQAITLCQSLVQRDQRMEAAYFEAIRVTLSRITGPRKISFREINRQINELLKQSIRSDGIINLFADREESFSLFDPAFLEEIARMKGKNLAMELLRKLLSEQIELYKRTNLVQAEKFSERMARIMNAYRNGQLTNAEVIDELRAMAEDIGDAHRSGESLGLSPEELAFYDAITRPEKVKDFYSNQQLCDMTRELTDALRKSRTIDWQKKESARAAMRLMVKRLLRKYKYPPEGVEDAVKVVIAQCELWAEGE